VGYAAVCPEYDHLRHGYLTVPMFAIPVRQAEAWVLHPSLRLQKRWLHSRNKSPAAGIPAAFQGAGVCIQSFLRLLPVLLQRSTFSPVFLFLYLQTLPNKMRPHSDLPTSRHFRGGLRTADQGSRGMEQALKAAGGRPKLKVWGNCE
jgi:hypothetical protein